MPIGTEAGRARESTESAADAGPTDRSPVSAAEDAEAGTVEYGAEKRELRYSAYGDPAGEPVVFLHGTPGSRYLGSLFDEPARGHGTRVLAPDRPGFGRSDEWRGRRPTDAAAWLEPLLAETGASTVRVVAFSGGAADALALGATRPDLVDRIDLVSGAAPPAIARETPGSTRLLGRLADRTPRLLGAAFRGQTGLAKLRSPSTVVGQYTDEPGRIAEATAKLVRRDFVESCVRSRNGAVTELGWVVDGWEFPVADVAVPVDLWHGERDDNVPVGDAERLRDRLPDAELTTLEADHLTALLASRDRALAAAPADGR